MRKYWPVGLLLVGVLVIFLAWFFVIRDSGGDDLVDEDGNIPEIPLEARPFAKLTPNEDGHWLQLKVEGLGKLEAASMDYELLYKVEDGRTQGVPGSIKLEGKTEIERDLLLGSESSGKFRYDEGVEDGTLTLRFRNNKGKLVGKLATQFHLQSGEVELTDLDNGFSYTLNKIASGVFFVTMQTFGLPAEAPGTVVEGPFGIFASVDDAMPGNVNLAGGTIYGFFGSKWEEIPGGSSDDIGVFISVSE